MNNRSSRRGRSLIIGRVLAEERPVRKLDLQTLLWRQPCRLRNRDPLRRQHAAKTILRRRCACHHKKAERAPRFPGEPLVTRVDLTKLQRCYGQGAGGFGNETGHGVVGITSPLLLILSMQFFSISWETRAEFPESVSGLSCSWSHAAVIRPVTVMFEQFTSNAPPSTKPKLTSSFNAASCADNMYAMLVAVAPSNHVLKAE